MIQNKNSIFSELFVQTPNMNTKLKYHNSIIAFHWIGALLILLAVCFALGREFVDSGSLRHVLIDFHRQCGLLVLLFVLPRLAARFITKAPAIDEQIPQMLRWVAGFTHFAIYAFMLALPLLGCAISGAKGQRLELLGILTVPSFVSADPDLVDTLEQWHSMFAWGFLSLLALHASAALWHHFVLKDATLQKMLPFAKITHRKLIPAHSTGEN